MILFIKICILISFLMFTIAGFIEIKNTYNLLVKHITNVKICSIKVFIWLDISILFFVMFTLFTINS